MFCVYKCNPKTQSQLCDPDSISDLQCTRLIWDSLLPPACDMVKHLSPDTLPDGTVQDGDEVYAKFMDPYQESPGGTTACSKERCSWEKYGQFCRGCWVNNLITELQLKQRKAHPPPFAEFLLLLRTEEDREESKTLRIKQYLGVTKPKVTAHAQFVRTEGETDLWTALTKQLTKQLSQQMNAIQEQVAACMKLPTSYITRKPSVAANGSARWS